MHLTECPSGSSNRVLRGILVVLLVIPSVALIFGDGRRMWHGMWLAVASGLWAIAVDALAVEAGRRGGAVGSDALLSFQVNSRRAAPNRYPTCRNAKLRPTPEIHSA